MRRLHFDITSRDGARLEDSSGVLVHDVINALHDCLDMSAAEADIQSIIVRDETGLVLMHLHVEVSQAAAAGHKHPIAQVPK